MRRTIHALGVLVTAGTLLAGCTAKDQDAPELSGPSVLATSITMSANPDSLRQDGASQATVTFVALDSTSQPVRNLPIRVDIAVGNTIVDYGQISARNIVTGSDGRASVVYTAPPPPIDPVDDGTVVQILGTPVGTDYGNANARVVSIRLVPPGVILPPNGTPVPTFSYSPSSPAAKEPVLFDASLSTDSDGQIVSYVWNFGDGSTGTGRLVTHAFQAEGSYSVSLTVTDDRGYSATRTFSVTVSAAANPTAVFVYSPSSPRPNDDIIFNASGSRAASGRTIVSYDWDFGTGRTGSGITVSKSYATPATYVVTLVVTDDVGNKGTLSQPVTVLASTLTANFTVSPTAPITNQAVFFDATPSVSGSNVAIVSWDWDFGDGQTGSGKNQIHYYRTVATYVVRLTVRDELGQTHTVTKSVSVAAPAVLGAGGPGGN